MCYAAIAGLALNIVGGQKKSQADAAGLEYQASVDEYNAEVANQEAITAERVGKRKVSDFRVQGKQFAGSQIAAAGSSGVEIGSGSLIDVEMDTARGIEADVNKLTADYISKRNAHLRARDLFLLDASMKIKGAERVREAGLLGGAATAASGSAKIYGEYKQSSYYSQGN